MDSNNGLLRFRSAPTSFLSVDCGVTNDFHELEDTNSHQILHGLPPTHMNTSYHPFQPQRKWVNSSLVRQNSSPPGLFTNFSVRNGYDGVNETSGEAISPSTNRMNTNFSFSSLGMISEFGANSPHPHHASNHTLGFPFGSSNQTMLSGAHLDGVSPSIRHQLSLPNISAEMDKFLQLQDSVPCKIRAKRGCATHPRSIAERVRRTRISERMRKLQDLVPNMDKQTNTADMLDLAVDYIKHLQKQFKGLNEKRAKCKCWNSYEMA